MEARGEATRNPQIACQLQRSLDGTRTARRAGPFGETLRATFGVQPLWRAPAPSGFECVFNGKSRSYSQSDRRTARATPGTRCGRERIRMLPNQQILLLRRDGHHAGFGVGISKCGEDLSSDSEVGVTHVRSFGGFGKRQRELAEIGSLH